MPTIAAIATPPGRGGISIVRISGPGAKSLLARVFLPHSKKFVNFQPWTMHHGIVLDADDLPLDDVLAAHMPGPRTFSGEDMAEIHCHGGHALARSVLESLLRLGARLAEPGEFTRRAYMNGRMDLSQAEAVAELIAAPSKEALVSGMARLGGAISRQVENLQAMLNELRALARVGVDFPDDEVEGLDNARLLERARGITAAIDAIARGARRAHIMAAGATVALAGPVNVGKSSLLNALAGRDRALVADIPGTTRDFIEELLDFDGLPVRLVDTAGLRNHSNDIVENLGMERSRGLIADADLVLFVLDAASAANADPQLLSGADTDRILLVLNKIDQSMPQVPGFASDLPICRVSALTGENLGLMTQTIRQMLLNDTGAPAPEAHTPPNARQLASLMQARAEMELFMADIEANIPCDCMLARLDTAAAALAAIVSLEPDDKLLDMIFSQFCIGK